MNLQESILKNLDIDYSYRLAKRMEQFRTNPVLGYRPAGSRAEFETGEMLKQEMEAIGLSDVRKDAVKVDGWEFKKAVLSYSGEDGTRHEIQLGAYQTTFVTDGPKEFSLMYLGKGTAADYEGKDVTGKLVLVDINQRDEWWINYPVYQAHLKGAAALIAVQSGGYGEIDDEALNAQDIAGPENAPAFSISRKDSDPLKELLERTAEITITLDADSRVTRDCTTYNIVGSIPGRHPDRMVLLSAHYDSYFSGFQDDNTAIALMFGIAKALLASGFTPNNTIVICAMAAEEWGVVDSNFDWSTGAYEQVFTAHPEWVGKVIADLNFELPALAHGTRARIRSCYEYTRFLEEYLSELPDLTQAYPEETRVTSPIETWSDDFSMAIAGIPSMVNDFTGGSFMETHYHSQFDNDAFYDEQVYRLHHELFALLIMALDETCVIPLCSAPVMKRALDGYNASSEILRSFVAMDLISPMTLASLAEKISDLEKMLSDAADVAESRYESRRSLNSHYRALLAEGRQKEAECLYLESREAEKEALRRFKYAQDELVRIDWYGNVHYPHEILLQNIRLIGGAIANLKEQNLSSALRKLYQVDNNAYAFMFDEEVYNHFTDYVLNQPQDRLKWGYRRLMPHENIYALVKDLLQKKEEEPDEISLSGEISHLTRIFQDQCRLLLQTTDQIQSLVHDQFLI
ncbi:M28 family peptidase [Clostridium sp. AM33-3]|jgi:Iap family predicted aminopeptidase|uniref:M28 family peptidase n=1 Tax=Clostridium sp. AM33-3 TaxID=2292304 RepID=UPI000E518152|nr:M28 family peptidase [Clostridium sp. AM33-3]RHT22844.1 peptidase [Clostridium sp. AM33-3]